MTSIRMTVNGRPVAAEVEPRTSLADFLRENLLQTGVHIGCEHGVCGACTVDIDGEPARSCITYAVACNGAEVTSIEGRDEDPVTAALREAFSREHALQCGYCTPGMLATARDIVLRLPEADEKRIRLELSGNLCRCTGYVGIVRAIKSVLASRKAAATKPASRARSALGPLGSPRDLAAAAAIRSEQPARRAAAAPATAAMTASPGRFATPAAPEMEIAQAFTVDYPRAQVWRFFHEVALLASCMPGAALSEPPSGNRIKGQLRIRLGPMRASFDGEGEIAWDEAHFRGSMRGGGRDTGSGSVANGTVSYALLEAKGGAATRVEVSVGFSLAGPLAQFSRMGIVSDLTNRLAAEFAGNLEAAIARAGGDAARATTSGPARELRAGSLLASVLWARIKGFLARLLGGR